MGIFSRKNEGGLMDVIRCDETDYLVWKWRPKGEDVNSTKKENAIRYGSVLHVRPQQVAVFVYKSEKGLIEHFAGPYEDKIETGNMPILASIVGLAYHGESPFPAEVYFVNAAGQISIPFAVTYFDVFDPRSNNFSVPVAVRGSIRFTIEDYKEIIHLYDLRNITLHEFYNNIESDVCEIVKEVVSNLPSEKQIPVLQLERKIGDVRKAVEEELKIRLKEVFGIKVTSLAIEAIAFDKTSAGYYELKRVTQDVETRTIEAQTSNMEETYRIQQEAMRLQNETANLTAFQLEKQAEVGMAGANALGQLGASGAGNINLGNGFGMNPAGMMAGMAMGSAIGQNMAGMVGGMMNGLNQQVPPQTQNQIVPPVPGSESFHVAVNGAATGPYSVAVLSTMVTNGQFTADSLVWKQGMANWEKASSVPSLAGLFASSMPPVPPQL